MTRYYGRKQLMEQNAELRKQVEWSRAPIENAVRRQEILRDRIQAALRELKEVEAQISELVANVCSNQ